MKVRSTKYALLALGLAASSVVLTGCIGGGGGSAASSSAAAVATISGTAGKGILKKARVKAYCGKKEGGDLLGSTLSGDGTSGSTAGAYSITASKACGQPVEISVEAEVVGTVVQTKMVDETQGEITAPATFNMTAMIPTASGSVTQNVTPFTHIAAQVAKQATTLDATIVNNATTAIVNNVLGGNAALISAVPKPTSDYNSANADEKQLLNLLTAISAAATNAGTTAVGSCTTTGDIQCVLNDMATKAKATIPTVSSSGYTVAPAATAATSPLDVINKGQAALTANLVDVKVVDSSGTTTIDASLTNTIKSDTSATALVSSATTNLTTNATTGTVAVANTSGISAARQLFATLRDSVLALSNDANTGFIDTKVAAMKTDMDSIQGTGVNLMLVLNEFKLAADLADAYANAGKPTVTGSFGTLATETSTPSSAVGPLIRTYFPRTYMDTSGSYSPISCRVYASGKRDDGITDIQGVVYCGKTYDYSYSYTGSSSTSTSQTMNVGVSKTSATTYGYLNWITTATMTTTYITGQSPSTTATNNHFTAPRYSGSFTVTVDSNNRVTGLAMSAGKLVPLVQGATDTTATLSANVTGDSTATAGATLAVTGSLVSGDLTMALLSGTTSTIKDATASADGSVTAKLIGQIKTSKFQYDGTFNLAAATKYTASTVLGQASFEGTISTLSNGTATEFFKGTLSGNETAKTASASLKVTDGSKLTQLTVGLNAGANPNTASIVYSFGGSYSLSFAATKNTTTGATTATITASDGTTITKDGTKIVIKTSAGTKIGEVNGGTVNFTDGTYFLLTGMTANVVQVSAT